MTDSQTTRRKNFSPRQSQILSLMAEGFSDKEIARKIGVRYPTVRTHIDRVFAVMACATAPKRSPYGSAG
jgi:DNA-binding NarL/FixJ family response regulator